MVPEQGWRWSVRRWRCAYLERPWPTVISASYTSVLKETLKTLSVSSIDSPLYHACVAAAYSTLNLSLLLLLLFFLIPLVVKIPRVKRYKMSYYYYYYYYYYQNCSVLYYVVYCTVIWAVLTSNQVQICCVCVCVCVCVCMFFLTRIGLSSSWGCILCVRLCGYFSWLFRVWRLVPMQLVAMEDSSERSVMCWLSSGDIPLF